tara:strand:+ start:2713 stop:3600 length:888 start_codon:yes stop_codon:yes gene_type:complete
MANIKDTLKETTKDLLSEDALNQIESVFDEAVNARAHLQVESAIAKQDEDHAGKVQTLLEAIDDDHSKKLENIVEAINGNHTEKLKVIVSRYQNVINEEAANFKSTLVDTISNYLELYLEKTFPADMMEEAVSNKRSESVLKEVRKLLGVDLALAKDTIREAVADGKNQLVTQNGKLNTLVQENAELKTKVAILESNTTLDDLSQNLPDHKKKYIYKVLGGKDSEFIKENFDYTIKLFDKELNTEVEQLTEEASHNVRGKVDTVMESLDVQSELPAGNVDDDPLFRKYMGELGKY